MVPTRSTLSVLMTSLPLLFLLADSRYAQRAIGDEASALEQSAQTEPGLVQKSFVFDVLLAPGVHASTLAETPEGLVAAWFGGRREGADDVGIWAARFSQGVWSRPTEIARCSTPEGAPTPCWNPVLFVTRDGALRLFFKAGPSPQRWWGMTQTSTDGAETWKAAERLPEGILGPIKNKPVYAADGAIISPSSTESSTDPSRWRVHFERSTDGGRTWSITAPPSQEIDAIQPSILSHGDGRLQAIGRTRAGRVFETWSRDGGRHWTALGLTSLPNPNSGLDAVTLRDGRQLVVYNHTSSGRSPLNVAVSQDGVTWEAALVLEREPGEYSYPAVVQAASGLVHVTYSWRRQRIRHVVLDPANLRSVPMPTGIWPDSIR